MIWICFLLYQVFRNKDVYIYPYDNEFKNPG
jgi:hypothetical protein